MTLKKAEITLLLALCAGSVILAGCGVYSFSQRGASTINSIAVEPFENDTPQFGLADLITEAVIDAIIADGNLRVVSPDVADALLISRLTGYQRQVERFDESDQVQEYKVVLDLEITLRNPADQSDIWSERVRQEGIYDAADESEEDGQRRAGARLVEYVLNRTTKSW
jgi:hypothetical protein